MSGRMQSDGGRGAVRRETGMASGGTPDQRTDELRRPRVLPAAAEQRTLIGLMVLVVVIQGARIGVFSSSRGLADTASQQVQPPRFQVPMNEADWPEWMLLPRIGEKRARAVVALRRARGGFRTLDEIRDVRGIGPKTLAALRPYLLEPAGSNPSDREP